MDTFPLFCNKKPVSVDSLTSLFLIFNSAIILQVRSQLVYYVLYIPTCVVCEFWQPTVTLSRNNVNV